jgi:hypothetical protein
VGEQLVFDIAQEPKVAVQGGASKGVELLGTEPTQEEVDALGNTAIESTEVSKAPEPDEKKP